MAGYNIIKDIFVVNLVMWSTFDATWVEAKQITVMKTLLDLK